MTPAEELARATKAKAVLDNPLYQESFEMCRLAIIDRIEKCPINDTESAENLRKCLRLLRDVQANMVVALNSGKMAQFTLEQEAAAKKNPFRGLFR
jgi:hypothetical protein